MSATDCWEHTTRRTRTATWILMILRYERHFYCDMPTEYLLIKPIGIALQPLDRPRPSLPLRPVPRYHLHLVGAAAREHLRFASRLAHQRLRLL